MGSMLKAVLLTMVLLTASTHAIEKDKVAHTSVSFVGTVGLSMMFHGFLGCEEKWAAAAMGAGLMLTVGFSKEVMDLGNRKYRQTGLDWGDMAANGVGVAMGAATFLLIAPDPRKPYVVPQLFPTGEVGRYSAGAMISIPVENILP